MIIPTRLTIYTQPEECMADLVNAQYTIDDNGDGKLFLLFHADLVGIAHEHLEELMREARIQIQTYADDHGLKLFDTASIGLSDFEAGYAQEDDSEEDTDDFDLYFGSDLQS